MTKTTRKPRVFAQFQSIAVCLAPGAPFSRRTARRVMGAVVNLNSWRLVPISKDHRLFEAVPKRAWRTPPDRQAASAWNHVYEVQAHPLVSWAEPLFAMPIEGTRTLGCYDDDPQTDDKFEWSLDAMFVKDAWQLFTTGDPGEDIRIAHPDTGFTDHAEILGSRLLADEGFNFEDPGKEDDPHDTLAGGFGRNPGHGTRTASVIMSDEGSTAALLPGEPFVSGVAPAASLIPIRTTKTAAIFNTSNLLHAIQFAVATPDVHIISISLGGPFKPKALHEAVIEAADNGIIVLCGAGNKFGFILSVAYPAAFDEVIAVAASTYDDTPWACSCRGPAVDVTAPGQSVWSAHTKKENNNVLFSVDRDSGTSFATGGVAGLAALWLSFHGRDELVAKYGLAGVPAVFKQLLQDSCSVPSGWPTDEFGAGIANAHDLLAMPLPAVAPLSMRADGRKPTSTEGDTLETIVHLAYPAPRSGVAWLMARALRVTEPMLPAALKQVGHEIAFHAATNMRLLRALQTGARAAIEPAARGKQERTREQWATTIRRQLMRPSASRRLRQVMASSGRAGSRKRRTDKPTAG